MRELLAVTLVVLGAVTQTGCEPPEQTIRRVWADLGAGPAVVEKAVRVARCETGGTMDPTVESQWTRLRGRFVGLFQIDWTLHAARHGYTKDDLLTAEANATVAYHVSRGGRNWSPWPVCGRR
jgi:hypothetical protein